MAETEIAAPVPAAASPKKAKAAKPKKPKTAPTHPKVSEMVNSAIGTLKERGGSSVQAIKKYIGAHYKVNVDKLAPFIKKYLKSAVAAGALVQTKGKGASGSFRITSKDKSAPAAAGTRKLAKPSSAKKSIKPKAAKKSVSVKKPKPKLAKSPKKPKAVKPKAPRVKKAKPVKKATKKARK